MSGRKLSPLEQKLHQAALADSKKTLTQKECEVLVPDAGARTGALNFLLGTGLLKAMKDAKGAVSFRAVMKKELDVKKDMSGEESMILSYIQAAATEGIWTKHLKAKTELHQTVIDRCLKSLTQKALIKAVKSVKFPTRKIYMLAHLEPSVEMTGGPWYTDNELDTEFIKLLCSACLRFIRDKSAPKQKSGDPSESSNLLYPISASPSYPTAQQLLAFLSKSRITETQLSVEHVEMLLNVLVLDGDVERLPAFGAAMWDTSEDRAGDASDEDDDRERSRRRKRKSRDEDDSPKRKPKRSKRSRSSSLGSDSESESEDEKEKRKRRKKRKSRDDSSASESEDEKERRKRKKKKRSQESSAHDGEDVQMSDEEGKRKSKSKSKSKKRRKYDTDTSDSESESGSDSDGDRRSRSRSSKSKSSKSKAKSKSKRERSSSPVPGLAHDFSGDDFGGSGAYVYRAVRQERIASGLSETPCVRCPSADFCKPGGPVNPQECTYYETWLVAADVAKD